MLFTIIVVAVITAIIVAGLMSRKHRQQNSVTNEGHTIRHSANPEAASRTDTNFPAQDKNAVRSSLLDDDSVGVRYDEDAPTQTPDWNRTNRGYDPNDINRRDLDNDQSGQRLR
jgi:type II secretory pathway pseudopilin PulG